VTSAARGEVVVRLLRALAPLAVTLAAVPVAMAVVTPPPTAAGAQAARSALVYRSDADNPFGLFGVVAASSADPSHPHPVLPTHGLLDVIDVQVSPDGQRVAALVDPTAGTGVDAGLYSLQVMDLDGSNRRTLLRESVTVTDSVEVHGFGWAGSSALVVGYFDNHYDLDTGYSSTTRDLRLVPLTQNPRTPPPPLPNTGALADPAVGPDATTVVATFIDPSVPRGELGLRLYHLDTHTRDDANLATGFIGAPAWSHDGQRIAFLRDTSTNAVDRSEIDVVTRSGGAWQPSVTLVATSGSFYDADPAWSPDDTQVWFDRADTASPTGTEALFSVDTRGQSGAVTQQVSVRGGDVDTPTFGAPDAAAPGAPTVTGFTLLGTSLQLRWAPPADSDYLYAVVIRNRGRPDERSFASSGAAYVDTAVQVGVTYSYDVAAVDAAGNTGPPSGAKSATALSPPRVAVADPTSLVSAGRRFPVRWSGGADPAKTRNVVQWSSPGGDVHVWRTGTGTGATFAGRPGHTYLFRAAAEDGFANLTAWSPWQRATVPLDQTAGRYTGRWGVARSPRLWLGSAAVTRDDGATATFTLTSRGVQVVGDRLPRGASFRVYVGSSYRVTVSTAATMVRHRQVLWRHAFARLATRTVRLVAVVRGARSLHLDGIGAPR
jgi:hypothetical protein